MLVVLAIAEFLGMTPWFSATAATPALIAEFHLDEAGASWITMAVQAGFVLGTLMSAMANLPDVLNPRRLFAIGCVIAAIANAMVTQASGPTTAIALRVLTGASLACVYPPGMKIAAGWFERGRGFALGAIVGALTAGKAFPHLLQALLGGSDWREPMLVASALTVVAGILVLTVVRDGPFVAVTAPFDSRAVFRLFTTPGARYATLGYLGHMWELYAMWTWVATFAVASLTAAHTRDAVHGGSLVAFAAIVSGTAGCLIAGWLADRVGKARVASAAMMLSAFCCAASPLVYGAPPVMLVLLVSIWGCAVVADSAQFSALVSEYTSRDHVGTALTVQTCVGFLLTMVTIRCVPSLAGLVGWQWAFLLLLPGPITGIIAMAPLRRRRA
jgi:MFS family permease